MEWLNIRQLFTEVLAHFDLIDLVSLDHIAFSWTYDCNLASKVYKPSMVFKQFSFVHLLDDSAKCLCSSAQRFHAFLDPLTAKEFSHMNNPVMHVRTTDLNIVQHPLLRSALCMGLNHIPLRPTDLKETISVATDAFARLYSMLRLYEYNLDLAKAIDFLQGTSLAKLQGATRCNKFGFKSSGPFLFDNPVVKNELEWLLSHLFVSGLDKANNNACFMCIRHIRLQAYDRLMGEDFSPCRTGKLWALPTSILDEVKTELLQILPEAPPAFNALPFLMASFKQHKQKYRWLTNAFQTIFTQIAKLITVASMTILESFKSWARDTIEGYRNILRCNTSIFWIVDSILQVTLNMPHQITDVYVADVTRCYESIPLEGEDNLLDALKFIIRHAYREAAKSHPKSQTNL